MARTLTATVQRQPGTVLFRVRVADPRPFIAVISPFCGPEFGAL
jgi:hypothetical protein